MDVLKQKTAREWLKRETASLHRRLDTMPQMRRLMRPDLNEQSYASTLSVLLYWTQSVAPAFRCLTLPDYADPLHKINALRQDLERLNYLTQPQLTAAPHTDEAFALGLHYVLEGASMGAQILAPRIETSLQRNDVTKFYRLYGDQTRSYWQSTQARLDAGLSNETARQRAGEGARWAFTSLMSRFEQEDEQLESPRTGVNG